MQSRLQPCSGCAAMVRAASRSGALAGGHGGCAGTSSYLGSGTATAPDIPDGSGGVAAGRRCRVRWPVRIPPGRRGQRTCIVAGQSAVHPDRDRHKDTGVLAGAGRRQSPPRSDRHGIPGSGGASCVAFPHPHLPPCAEPSGPAGRGAEDPGSKACRHAGNRRGGPGPVAAGPRPGQAGQAPLLRLPVKLLLAGLGERFRDRGMHHLLVTC